jgi:hypothetical protein
LAVLILKLLAAISTLAQLLNVFVHTALLCLSAPVASAPKAIPGLRTMLNVVKYVQGA